MLAMFNEWDFMHEDLIHLTREFVALSVLAWGGPAVEFLPRIEPLVQWVRETVVETAPHDFPFLMAVRTMLLLATDGPECVDSLLAPALDLFLAEPAWRFEGQALATGRKFGQGSPANYVPLW